METWSQYSWQKRFRRAGPGSGIVSASSDSSRGLGGFSNIWLVASQLETAVRVSMLMGVGLVLRGSFGDEGLSEPACFCAALVLTGGWGWE